MAWTNLLQPFPGQKVDDAYLNSMRSNLLHVHDTNISIYKHNGSGVDWTSTSTVMTPVDNTLFNRSLTTNGGPVVAIFFCTFKLTAAGAMWFSIHRVGEDIESDEQPLSLAYMNSGVWKPHTLIKPFPNLPAGTHNFRVMWKRVTGTGTMTIEALTKPWLAAVESI